jgi:hypothetical protein
MTAWAVGVRRVRLPGGGTSRSRRIRGLVIAVVGLYLLFALLAKLLPGPTGPTGSSYATSRGGVAAYADLLARTRHPISRIRQAPDSAALDPDSTLVIIEPDEITGREAAALGRFVRSGGTLVAGGSGPQSWLRGLFVRPPAWSAGGPLVAQPVNAGRAPLADVAEVRTAGEGRWNRPGELRAILGGPGETLALTKRLGGGQVFLLADPSPLQNRLLGEADNAALGVALAGEASRPVAFLETVHGYGQARGIAALPSRWLWALGGLILAVLLWLAAHARRLGPPELETRPLPPPRRAYIDALATLLARTRRVTEAAAPVSAAARERLMRRAALPRDAGADEVARAAGRYGLTPEEAAVMTSPPRNEGEALAAGRALARLGGSGGGSVR